MTPKRCICKRSAQYPLCDGSHADKPWCSPTSNTSANSLIIASPSLSNLAEWWSHKVNAQILSDLRQSLQATVEEVWVLFDGTQLPLLKALLDQIPHKRQRWVHTSDNAILPTNWIDARQQHMQLPMNFDLETLDPTRLQSFHPIQLDPINIFVSHAVSDEPLLMPVLKQIQQIYDVHFFICAEIGNEDNWYAEIDTHLKECDVVWAFTSRDFAQSTFCAFEIGMTKALTKPLHIFALDASNPPAYIQHQQIQSLRRTHAYFPWLSETDILEQMCLQSLRSIQTASH